MKAGNSTWGRKRIMTSSSFRKKKIHASVEKIFRKIFFNGVWDKTPPIVVVYLLYYYYSYYAVAVTKYTVCRVIITTTPCSWWSRLIPAFLARGLLIAIVVDDARLDNYHLHC